MLLGRRKRKGALAPRTHVGSSIGTSAALFPEKKRPAVCEALLHCVRQTLTASTSARRVMQQHSELASAEYTKRLANTLTYRQPGNSRTPNAAAPAHHASDAHHQLC